MAIVDTVWKPADGNGEYAGITALDIVDPSDSSIQLADPTGDEIVSTDVSFTPVPETVWTENEAE